MWDKHTGESSRGGILGTSNRSLHTHSETSSTVSAGTQKYMRSSKEAGTVYYFSCVLQINTLSSSSSSSLLLFSYIFKRIRNILSIHIFQL